MLNHVAFHKLPLPQRNVELDSLCHGELPKVISALFTALKWGGKMTKFVFLNVPFFPSESYLPQ
jgi:hypothetical protein